MRGQTLKLTIEPADDLAVRLQAAAQRKGSSSIRDFVCQVIKKELQRSELDGVPRGSSSDVATLMRQVQKLENGQRAIVAMMDSSAKILAALLRRQGASR
jgi:hypothetical protein